MKKEELIAQLQLLPDNADIFVRLNDRIAEPLLCIYSVEPHPNAEKLVGYIDTFFGTLERQLKEVGGDMVGGNKTTTTNTFPIHSSPSTGTRLQTGIKERLNKSSNR